MAKIVEAALLRARANASTWERKLGVSIQWSDHEDDAPEPAPDGSPNVRAVISYADELVGDGTDMEHRPNARPAAQCDPSTPAPAAPLQIDDIPVACSALKLAPDEVCVLLDPSELMHSESTFVAREATAELEAAGINSTGKELDFARESSLKGLFDVVADALEGRRVDARFFVRRKGHVCTGIAWLIDRRSKRRRGAEELHMELRGFASCKGGGALLHWHMCRKLCAQEVPVRLTLPLMTCTWRAGEFYRKMGWHGSSQSIGGKDVGGAMTLEVRELDAWHRYFLERREHFGI